MSEPNVNSLTKSRYLTKDDVGDGKLLTISSYQEEDVSQKEGPEEIQWVLYFNECEKGMVLKPTNGNLIMSIVGSGNFKDWPGKQIVLWNDTSVMFAGKRTGGIRAKAPSADPGRQIPTDTVADDGPPVASEADLASADNDQEIPF